MREAHGTRWRFCLLRGVLSDTRHVRRNFRNSADGGRTRRDTSVRPRVARVLLKGPSSTCTGSNTILALRCAVALPFLRGSLGGSRNIARSPRYLGNNLPALSAAKGYSGRGNRWTGSSPRFATKHSGTEATDLTHLPLSLQRLHKSKHHHPHQSLPALAVGQLIPAMPSTKGVPVVTKSPRQHSEWRDQPPR